MIHAITGRGQNRARVTCDGCGTSDVTTCDYLRGSGGSWTPNEGQILKKLSAKKWGIHAGNHLCPICEAKRKASNRKPDDAQKGKESDMTAATKEPGLREPTARMTAQIVGLLEDAYDGSAKRYRNPADSDRTIAEVIGGGCMWGWVARIREAEFGPDTRSAEVEAIRAEFRKLDGRISAAIGEIRDVETAANDLRVRLEKLA